MKPKRTKSKPTDTEPEALARKKLRRLWQLGDLFHVASRYPRKPGARRVDRLAGIVKNGLVAPALCEDGSAFSDLSIVVTGCKTPYDSLVFLHRFGPKSYLYTMCNPGRFAVFVEPTIPVLTPDDMGRNWVELCQDEVYVPERIVSSNLIGIAVCPTDAASVMDELLSDFQSLAIPLYDYDGTVWWPPGQPARD